MQRRHRKIYALAAFLASVSPAWATPADYCNLLTPFFDDPPKHFLDMRGPKTSDKVWNSKGNAQADALNATCSFNAYLEHQTELDCTINFDVTAISDQDAAYKDAIVGVDYCLGSLAFGTRVRRALDHSDDQNLESDSVSWYRTKVKDRVDIGEFGATVTRSFNRSVQRRDVNIKLYYQSPQ